MSVKSRSTKGWKVLPLLAVFLMVVTACGGDGSNSAGGDSTTGPEGRPSGGKLIIRFAFAPDPVMDYLKDTGTLAAFEEAWNVRLEMTSSWDEFAFFAGGHGDIVSMSTLDMPLLEQETGVKVVGFGKYNHTRLIYGVKCDSGYQTLEDLKGKRFGNGNPVTTERLTETLLANLYDDIHYPDDFEVVNNDHPVLPELIARGDVDVAFMIPEFGVPFLREGEVCGLYDGRAAFEVFRDELLDGKHEGLESNLFVAQKEWFESHPYEVQFFLALWEEGVRLWAQDQKEIIPTYPQHFSVESEEDIEYISNWIADHQFFADTVYLDQDWVDGETQIFDLAKNAGEMEADAPNPDIRAVARDIPDGIDIGAISAFGDY